MVVTTGTAATQIISLLAAPILTRLFSPGDFGILAIFASFATILAIIFTLQYDMAIVLPKKDKEAKELMGIATKLAACFLVIFFLLASIVFFTPIFKFIGLGNVPLYIAMLSVLAGFLIAIERSYNYWNIRKKAFRIISIALIFGTLLSMVFKISLGYFTAGAWVLILGTLLAHIINIFIQIVHGENRQVLKESFKRIVDKSEFNKILRNYSDFPKFRMPQSLLNAFGNNIPVILLVSFFSPAVGGFYALANRVIRLPSAMISEAIRKVFYQKASELNQKGSELFTVTLKMTLWLVAIGFIPFMLFAMFSSFIFPFVFGEEWRIAGIYASYLTIWMYTVFCNTPATSIMPVLRLQKRYLFFNIVIVIIRIIAITIGVVTADPLEAIIYLTVVGVLYNVIVIIDVHIQAYRAKNLLFTGESRE